MLTLTKTEKLQIGDDENDDKFVGVGMDCAIIPIARFKDFNLVQSVDYFYPLVDDPYIMGKIAFANVVSDMYAVGVTKIDNLLVILSAPTELNEHERDIIIPMIYKGFKDLSKTADCNLNISNFNINPWCMVGGIATTYCKDNEIISPYNAQVGDYLILTKALGTQIATNLLIWMQEKNDKYQKIANVFTDNELISTFNMAVKSMTTLNKVAAELMHKYNAHAATDVTGFGLLGHAQNLSKFQKETLLFQIDKLPFFKNILKLSKVLNDNSYCFGKSTETSGGLLISLPADDAKKFCSEIANITNGEQNAWIIGKVLASKERIAKLADNVELIEI